MKPSSFFKMILIAIAALALPQLLYAQDEPEYGIKFGGFVKVDAYSDSRQITGARDDMFVFYPAPRQQTNASPTVPIGFFDGVNPATATPLISDPIAEKIYIFGNNDDLNARGQTGFSVVQSRISGKITAPDAFGAKITGLIEGDFFGPSDATKYAFGLRHAWVNFDWGKTNLRAGQDWHPLFMQGGVFPDPVNFSPLAPIHPFGRAGQVALTQKMGDLTLGLYLLEQSYHADIDGSGTPNNLMQRRSKLPEAAVQLIYKLGGFTVGGTFDHREIVVGDDANPTLAGGMPNTVVGNNRNRVQMNTYQAFAQFKADDFAIKIATTMGDNYVNINGIGGYGVKQTFLERNLATIATQAGVDATEAAQGAVAYSLLTKREYSPFQIRSYWAELVYGKNIEFGLLGGVTENLGARDEIDSSKLYGRATGNLKQVTTIAPRVRFKSGRTVFGIEYNYSVARYLEDDKNQRALHADIADNYLIDGSNYSIAGTNGTAYLNKNINGYLLANDDYRDSKGKINRTYSVANHRIQLSVQQFF